MSSGLEKIVRCTLSYHHRPVVSRIEDEQTALLLLLDGVNQDGRSDDNHLVRLDGDSGCDLVGHGIDSSCGWWSLTGSCDHGFRTQCKNRPTTKPVAPRSRRSSGDEYPQKMAVRDFQRPLFGTRIPAPRKRRLRHRHHGVLPFVACGLRVALSLSRWTFCCRAACLPR